MFDTYQGRLLWADPLQQLLAAELRLPTQTYMAGYAELQLRRTYLQIT